MFSPDLSSILKYLNREKEQWTGFLKELVQMESPSTAPDTQAQVLHALQTAFIELDMHTFRIPGTRTGGHLYARPNAWKKESPVQLLIGHCDTVWPVSTLERMPVKVEKERFLGPGVYDMKAGLTQILFALKTLSALGLSPDVIPIVFINSDEEIGSRESTPWIRRLAKIADRAFILEPSLGPLGKLKTGRKGVGRFHILIRGKSAHAGLEPGKGASAIVELSHVIQQLFEMNDPEKGVTVNVGKIEGGTRANVVASESRAVVDVRVPTHADAERISRQIRNIKPLNPEIILEIEGRIGRPPMEHTPPNRKLWEMAKKEGRKLKLELEEAMAGGGSDGNTTSQYTATLDGLGAVGGGAHALHEFMYIDQMIERTALLVLLLLMDPVKNEVGLNIRS